VAARQGLGWLIIGAVAIFAFWYWYWDVRLTIEPTQQDSNEPLKTTVVEWLDDCSPFVSFDGQRMLTFDTTKQAVTASEALDDERSKGALMAKHPKEQEGLWSADEETRHVSVEIEGSKSDYILVIPFDEQQCLLVSGSSLSEADLTKTLYGVPYFSDTVDEQGTAVGAAR